ncbi:MAG: hypothetical protein GEU73_15935 [Chloroflexi bacterium]|nr:hypothetical protein [Chloroflexota bacterium]
MSAEGFIAEHVPRLRSLAIVATRGTSNNLFQVATLVRAATALEAAVDVLFRDDALRKLQRDRLNVPEWSLAYARVQSQLEERLQAADFTDMETFLRDAKEHGDAVHYWACSETLGSDCLRLADLSELVDEERPTDEFLAFACGADALMIF